MHTENPSARHLRRGAVRAALTLLVVLSAGPLAAQTTHDPGTAPGGPGTPQLPALDAETVPPAVLDDVALLLSGVHGAPDRALLEANVPAAREVLMVVARDPELLPAQRPQALWALAQWGDEEVVAVYLEVLAANDPLLVHDALLLLGRVGTDAAVPTLRAYLTNADLQVRLSAIAALGDLDSDSAVRALEGAEAVETNHVARERIAQALQRVR